MIKLKKLDFNYGKKAPLFNGLSGHFEAGNIYGLLGKNGAGKTTLLKCISGLLLTDPSQAIILGKSSTHRHADILSELIFIPEEFYTPDMTAKEYLLSYAPFYPAFDHKRMKSIMNEFELKIDEDLNNYSYGMKKKFLIAFALSSGTRILLLDEPTNGLDIPSKSQFRKVLAGSLRDDQLIIISTHQVRDMKQLIDPIVIIDAGRILLNSDLQTISEKLQVSESETLPDDENILYSEDIFGKYTLVKKNQKEKVSKPIDLELLFNTVIAKPEWFMDNFSGGAK
ncbi:MAG: ABC transporter ATP-binding protein [Candidatus Marinimicrobia bacterium]|nr:ABC transporter ATP-binding protein [Candidatus Neomarinimicrobiota bacterium]